jgi:hypothetical protein
MMLSRNGQLGGNYERRLQSYKKIFKSFFLFIVVVALCLYLFAGGDRPDDFFPSHQPWSSPPSSQDWDATWFLNPDSVSTLVQSMHSASQQHNRALLIGFYHIATVGFYESVVRQQLRLLTHAPDRPELGHGLWDHLDYLFVGIYANASDRTRHCREPVTNACLVDSFFADNATRALLLHPKVLIFGQNRADQYERPSLNFLQQLASRLHALSSKHDHVFAYAHSKGVTWNFNDSAKPNTIYNWVQATTYYSLGAGGRICASKLMEENVAELDVAHDANGGVELRDSIGARKWNTCGMYFQNYDPFVMHFSGNMWMARSSWLAKNRPIASTDQFCLDARKCPCNGNAPCSIAQEKRKIFDAQLRYVAPEFWLFGSHDNLYNLEDLDYIQSKQQGWLYSSRETQLRYQRSSNICAIYQPPRWQDPYRSFVDLSWIRLELADSTQFPLDSRSYTCLIFD